MICILVTTTQWSHSEPSAVTFRRGASLHRRCVTRQALSVLHVLQHQSYLCFIRRTLHLVTSATAAQRAEKSCPVTYIAG